MIGLKFAGLAVGLFLGFVWVVWSFGDMVLVALVGIVGYLVAAFLGGDPNLEAALRRLNARR